MATDVKQLWIRRLIRVGIGAALLLVFALHVQGVQQYELIDRIESYLYDDGDAFSERRHIRDDAGARQYHRKG